jgi:hypothetical protein
VGLTTRHRCARVLAAAALALLAGPWPGCAIRPKSPLAHQSAGPGGVQNPFAVASMHIHPLTRLDRDTAGAPILICHLEFKDTWDDTCKGVGKLSIQLYRPTGGRASGLGSQELAWDVDLSSLDTNAALYDPATRTYRIPLDGAASPSSQERDLPKARLRAVFTTPGPHGEERVLEDEYPIG